MNGQETERSLALSLRHAFPDLLDLPLLSPRAAAPAGPSPSEELARYAERIRFCESCSFHIGRSRLVFGRGHWEARIAFVGDFPSSGDDREGQPFTGEEGALLDKMILAMKIRPEEAYLTNVFKCRPPAGDRPGDAHLLACQTHLIYQLSLVRAHVIVAMGETAAGALASSGSPLRVLRRQIFEWQGRQVIPTHHPRDLHHSPALKKEAWADLQSAMKLLEARS